MSDRRRQTIVVGAAGVGLFLVLLIARSRKSGVPVVSSSPSFAAGNLGGGSFESSGGGGGLFSGFSVSDVVDAIKATVQPPAAPAPVNVTVTTSAVLPTEPPAAPPAPVAPGSPSEPSQPGPSNQPLPEGTKPPSSNYRKPWVQTDDEGRQVAIVYPGRGRAPIGVDSTTF